MNLRSAALSLSMVWILAAGVPAEAASRQTLYPCDDQTGFSNTTLTLITTVKPTSGMTWTFPEAPSVVAQRVLTNLNANAKSITFKEANGVIPNLYINVTLSETNSGTQQDTAYAEVTGLAKAGTLFRENSGAAPYIGWRDAIDHLVTKMLVWFEQGWHGNPPCRLPDGSTRTHWP